MKRPKTELVGKFICSRIVVRLVSSLAQASDEVPTGHLVLGFFLAVLVTLGAIGGPIVADVQNWGAMEGWAWTLVVVFGYVAVYGLWRNRSWGVRFTVGYFLVVLLVQLLYLTEFLSGLNLAELAVFGVLGAVYLVRTSR